MLSFEPTVSLVGVSNFSLLLIVLLSIFEERAKFYKAKGAGYKYPNDLLRAREMLCSNGHDRRRNCQHGNCKTGLESKDDSE